MCQNSIMQHGVDVGQDNNSFKKFEGEKDGWGDLGEGGGIYIPEGGKSTE